MTDYVIIYQPTYKEVWLLDMKPNGLFHSNSQLLVQQLVAVIGWQVNTVETADKSITIAGNSWMWPHTAHDLPSVGFG